MAAPRGAATPEHSDPLQLSMAGRVTRGKGPGVTGTIDPVRCGRRNFHCGMVHVGAKPQYAPGLACYDVPLVRCSGDSSMEESAGQPLVRWCRQLLNVTRTLITAQ